MNICSRYYLINCTLQLQVLFISSHIIFFAIDIVFDRQRSAIVRSVKYNEKRGVQPKSSRTKRAKAKWKDNQIFNRICSGSESESRLTEGTCVISNYSFERNTTKGIILLNFLLCITCVSCLKLLVGDDSAGEEFTRNSRSNANDDVVSCSGSDDLDHQSDENRLRKSRPPSNAAAVSKQRKDGNKKVSFRSKNPRMEFLTR